MATRLKSPITVPHSPATGNAPVAAASQLRKGTTMLTKLIVAIVLTMITASIPETRGYAVWVFFIAVVAAFVVEGVRIVPQQSAYVVERLGRFHSILQPGLNLIIPFLDRLAYTHSLKEVPLDVPEQVCITKDNTQLAVDGILYYQVTDPRLASYGSANYVAAISQLAQTTLRSVVGQFELDEILSQRDKVNAKLQIILDQDTEPWGIKVSKVEVKQVDIPEQMQRAIAKQAEAERERRAKIIHAEGEFEASQKLADAAKVLETQPTAIQLRYLQTLTEIGVEKNTTIVFPLPIDIINNWMKSIGGSTR